MFSPEMGMIRPPDSRPIGVFKSLEEFPDIGIVRHTDELLDNYYYGMRSHQEIGSYLQDTTMPYLRRAEGGSSTVYNREGELPEGVAFDSADSAHHAFVVLAVLSDKMTSPLLPNGFSKRGVLRAPETREEYLRRIRELKFGVWQIAEAIMKPRTNLMSHPAFLRTFAFFRVASELPLKEPTGDTPLRAFLQG